LERCDPVLQGYTGADYAGDEDSRKSTSGYMMTYAGGAVSWQSKLQNCISLSTTDAEYIAAVDACKEVIWMKKLLAGVGHEARENLFYDNQSAIHLTKNPSFHSRTKHIDVRYHWIREVASSKLVQLDNIHTDKNDLDMMTKILPQES
jgi:hypothetical protein